MHIYKNAGIHPAESGFPVVSEIFRRINYLLNLNPTKVIIVKYVSIINVKRRVHQRKMHA